MSGRSTVNQKERAARVWPILVEAAKSSGTVSYGFLAKKLGTHHRPIRFVLSEIQDYCLEEKLPPITILVVNQRGVPGEGFIAWDVDDLEHGFQKVYSYPWDSVENPFQFALGGATVESLATALFEQSVTSTEVYSKVKVRGAAQLIFRELLLRTYDGHCAVSGIMSRELLQAAHIVPWSQASPSERIDPTNGILMSVLHHRLFDLGWLQIGEDYVVSTNLKKVKRKSEERRILDNLHGRKLDLPRNKNHWPNQAFIRRRNSMNLKLQISR